MRKLLILAVLALLLIMAGHTLLPFGVWAAWDPDKPATNSALVSADLRNNWTAIGQSQGAVNLLADSTFLIWAAGDAAAPSYYTLSGAGAGIARSGTGLGDTTRKWGLYAAKVTAGGASAYLHQSVLSASSYDDGMDGREWSVGAWVYCASASSGRIGLYDGVVGSYSSYATAATWTWLTATQTIDSTATQLVFNFEVATNKTCYLSAPTVILGPVTPKYPQPSQVETQTLTFLFSGNCATSTDKAWFSLERPAILREVQLHAVTAPATQALIADVEVYDGSGWNSAYSTRPQIAATATSGSAAPDATYRYRTFAAMHGTTTTDARGRLQVDQCGSGTVGADLTVHLRFLTFARPLEQFLLYSE